jgi:shikimate kinase
MNRHISEASRAQAIELLAEGNKTYIEVAKESDISVDTLREWRKDPSFQSEVRTRCRDLLKEREAFLYNAALQQIKKTGSHQHIKLLLERLERMEDIAEGRGQEYDVMFTWKTKEEKSIIE